MVINGKLLLPRILPPITYTDKQWAIPITSILMRWNVVELSEREDSKALYVIARFEFFLSL
jgi:hypothetical protein